MSNSEIVRRLEDSFRSGAIPRELSPPPVGDLEGRETMIINGGRGQRCSACGDLIGSYEQLSVEYLYPTIAIRFHHGCDELWRAEREKPIRRTP